jgi:hypothetical protein
MFIRPFPTSHAAARANRRSRIATLSSFVVAGTVTFLVLAGFAKIIPAEARRAPVAERVTHVVTQAPAIIATPVVLPTVKVIATR